MQTQTFAKRAMPSGGTVLSCAGWTAIGLSIICVLVVSTGLTSAQLASVIGSVPIWVYAILGTLQVAILLMASLKWCIILDQVSDDGTNLPLKDALAGTTLGTLAGQILPIQIVTPLTRAWVARPHRISSARAVGTSLFEQVFEVAVLLTMGLVSVLLFFTNFGMLTALTFAGLAGLCLVTLIVPMFRLLRYMVIRATNILPSRLSVLGNTFATALLRPSSFPKPVILSLTTLSALRYVCLVTLYVGTITILLPGVDMVMLMLAYPAILLVMSLPIFPGGLGVVELSWTGVLVAQGVDPAHAVEIALALRIVTTLAFLVVAPFLILLRTRKGSAT